MTKIFFIFKSQFFPGSIFAKIEKMAVGEMIRKKKPAKKGTIVYSCLHFPHNLTREVIRCSALFQKVYLNRHVRDRSSITSSKRWVGGVRQSQFLMIYSTVNHQKVGGPKKVTNMMT